MIELPGHYKAKKYLLYELIGALVVLILFIIILTKEYVRFDWMTVTLWLASAILLVLPELTKAKPIVKFPEWFKAGTTGLLFCLYLFLYHFFATVFSLRFGGFELILYLGGTVLFGLALYLRSNEAGIDIKKFDWKEMLRYPAWPFTTGITLALLALFFPMTRVASFGSTYGPQFGYNAYDGYGYNNWGFTYYQTSIIAKGYMAHLGSFACLLLSFMLVFHLVKAAGKKTFPKHDMLFKIAVAVMIAWWIFGAKGYDALKGFGNFLFIPGIILLVFTVYFPDKLGELVKKKGLIK